MNSKDIEQYRDCSNIANSLNLYIHIINGKIILSDEILKKDAKIENILDIFETVNELHNFLKGYSQGYTKNCKSVTI